MCWVASAGPIRQRVPWGVSHQTPTGFTTWRGMFFSIVGIGMDPLIVGERWRIREALLIRAGQQFKMRPFRVTGMGALGLTRPGLGDRGELCAVEPGLVARITAGLRIVSRQVFTLTPY